MKLKCPQCGATVDADDSAQFCSCLWCGKRFATAQASAVEISAAAESHPGIEEIPQPNHVLLQAGGALLFSGAWMLGFDALFMVCEIVAGNKPAAGMIAMQALPLVGILVAFILAGIFYGICRAHGLKLHKIAGLWGFAILYGAVLWAFTFNALMTFSGPASLEVGIVLAQLLLGALLLFLAVP